MKRAVISLAVLVACSTAVAEAPPRPNVDVVFALDTTSSMSGEIEAAKRNIKQMVALIDSGDPTPRVRVGVVAYRDHGDAYVTKTIALTRDIDEVVKQLGTLRANGGGDTPEDVQAALQVALAGMKWDPAPSTTRLIFLVGDAPDHAYPDEPSMASLAARANEQGVVVSAVACGSYSADTERAFGALAQAAHGRSLVLPRDTSEGEALKKLVVEVVRGELDKRGVKYQPGS